MSLLGQLRTGCAALAVARPITDSSKLPYDVNCKSFRDLLGTEAKEKAIPAMVTAVRF
jgi:hypothetical protein